VIPVTASAGVLESIATVLDGAVTGREPIAQLAERGYQLTLSEAYAVQSEGFRLREARGEHLIGVKMGFTSQAKRAQMGIDDLIWGRISDAMCVESRGGVSLGDFIHPRIEPELAFQLGSPLRGTVSIEEAQAAIEGVAAALEIIDSRYRNFRFSLADVVADNSSSAAIIVGPWQKPLADYKHLGIVMSFNGRAVEVGSSAAIMGDPLLSLVAAARLAGDSGITLEAGWVVMAGGATAAQPLTPDTQVWADVESLGRAEVNVLE